MKAFVIRSAYHSVEVFVTWYDYTCPWYKYI